MAKKRKRESKWKEARFEDLDRHATSLGDMLKELASKHPNLVIEKAGERGVKSRPDDSFANGKKHGNKLILWHGTTERRARAIVSQGFISPYPGAWIWMTPRHNYARSHAIHRARPHSEAAVLFQCGVDLSEYSEFAKHGPHFAFRYSHISRHVIRKVFRLEFGKEEPDSSRGMGDFPHQKEVITLIDVAVTKDSGKHEVLCWINECLKLMDEEAVDEDHPAVEAMFSWAQTQYANGRNDPITEEEMLLKISEVSINQASRHFHVGTQVIEQWIDKGLLKTKSLRECPIVPLQMQGIQVKRNRRVIKVWHGTTEDRAKAIIEEGFRKAQVWFTSKLPVAQRMAINRARQRSDVPVVISCEIDLEKYPSFGRPDPKTYVFYSPTGKEIIGGVTLGRDVVRDVSVVKAKYSRRSKEKADTHEPIDVIVTKTSGRLGVLWWINRYLELEGEAAVNEDHPAVKAIFKWVEAQYAQGIDDPIPDEEMLAQVKKHLRLES